MIALEDICRICRHKRGDHDLKEDASVGLFATGECRAKVSETVIDTGVCPCPGWEPIVEASEDPDEHMARVDYEWLKSVVTYLENRERSICDEWRAIKRHNNTDGVGFISITSFTQLKALTEVRALLGIPKDAPLTPERKEAVP